MNITFYQDNGNVYGALFSLPVRSPLKGSMILGDGTTVKIIDYDLATPWFGGFSPAALPPNALNTCMVALGYIFDVSFTCDFNFTFNLQINLGNGVFNNFIPAPILVTAGTLFSFTSKIVSADRLIVNVVRTTANVTTLFYQCSMTVGA